MKTKFLPAFITAASLISANSLVAGPYVGVICPKASFYDLKPGTDTFNFHLEHETGERIELDDGQYSAVKTIESMDRDLVTITLKNHEGQWPRVNIRQRSGAIETSQIKEIKVFNQGINVKSGRYNVDVVVYLGKEGGNSYSVHKATGCHMLGGRVDIYASRSWFKAFQTEP